jgi:hypothetical protein
VEERVIVIVVVDDPNAVSAPAGPSLTLVAAEVAETVAFPALAMREEKRGPRSDMEVGKPEVGRYTGIPPSVVEETAGITLVVTGDADEDAVGASLVVMGALGEDTAVVASLVGVV